MGHQCLLILTASIFLIFPVFGDEGRLAERLQKQERSLERLKIQNRVLKSKIGGDFHPATRRRTLAARAEIKKLPRGERHLYAYILNKYRAKEDIEMNVAASTFFKKFPLSPFADNIAYLQGMLLFENQKFGPAVQRFQFVIDRFPNGNKKVSALFAKAITYKNLNLPHFASDAFRSVIKQFPGSQEANRSQMELRLLGPAFQKSASK